MNLLKERERLVAARDEMNELIAAADKMLAYHNIHTGIVKVSTNGKRIGRPRKVSPERMTWKHIIEAARKEGVKTVSEFRAYLTRTNQHPKSLNAVYSAWWKWAKER